MESHKYRPSKMGLRAICPGSAEAEEGQPNIDSAAAEEGTMLHEVMAGKNYDLTEEQAGLIEECRKFDKAHIPENAKIDREVPLTIRVGGMEIPGTADLIAYYTVEGGGS